jgi:omega-6 fatty acid desaturase (delta-12 desaturase)
MMSGPSPAQRASLARFAKASLPRALWQLANTLPTFLALWVAMAWTREAGWSYWWTLLLALPTAALYVRLFILQHDCSHGSFFASSRANRWVGASLGLLTLFPFAYWKKTHGVHHATSGNLDERVLGDIRTMTVEEYRTNSPWMRFCYRFYRSMPVMLGIGPIYQFVAKHRLPLGMPWSWKKEWRSVALNNLALLAVGFIFGALLDWRTLLLVQLPVVAIAGAFGVWLFYVQHCFEKSYWVKRADWDPHAAAVDGSSFYDLPPVLRWITCNIGYHHIHHLAPRIPNYHLRAAHEANPALQPRVRMGLRDSLACARMKLWDESLGRMVAFPR